MRTFLLLMVVSAAPIPALRAAEPAELARQARAVLKQYCQRCHNGEGSEGGNFDVLNDKSLITDRDGEKAVVVPGKADSSLLWRRSGIDKSMPPKRTPEHIAMKDEDREALKNWIAAGAPAFPTEEKTRKFISLSNMLTTVRDHLRDTEVDDRPYQRYFTITHLYNNPRIPEADLIIQRAALSKAINSLSWKPRIVLPKPLDAQRTVFVVDIRDLDWDRDRIWKSIMVHYPYALTHDNGNDPAVSKIDDDIRSMTGCRIPVVRSDWFVASAARPSLYHVIMKTPKNAKTLEAELKVDVAENFKRDRLDRAGFIKSGVSEQNRLIERHESAYGAYWKSYDFKKGRDNADLVKKPLGPHFDRHPFADLVFEHDGGEIIFNLPNGLQGYMLVDGKDERIDEGPIDVVSDPLKTSGTNMIINGLSCLACHKHGAIAAPKDVIRDAGAVFGEAQKKVRRLYPEPNRMAELVEEDQQRFMKALEKAIGPFMKEGPYRELSPKEWPEPVGEVSRLYSLQELDRTAVACELYIEKPETLTGMILGSKRLRELGMAPLTKDGGCIKREEWQRGANSMMQRCARELEIGVPAREVE